MYKNLDSALREESVLPHPGVKMGPERSLRGLTRIEVEPVVEEIVTNISPEIGQDYQSLHSRS